MASSSHLSPRLLAAREKLERGRRDLNDLHEHGLSGVNLCSRLTSLVDSVVVQLFQSLLAEFDSTEAESLRSRIALVAHGGYGRRHLAPYSDVDIMVLYSGKEDQQVTSLAKHFMQDVFDVGLDLGQSVRTPEQAWLLAKSDIPIFTSLVESRRIIGSESLFQRFAKGFHQLAQKQFAKLYSGIRQARRDERQQYGDTVYLLEPNLKRSRGSLRELHLLRWMAYGKFGVADPDSLRRLKVLSKEDLRRLTNAREFLLQLRNEMHFHASQARDVLHRSEQLRVAEKLGYSGQAGVLPVEEFMSDYFRHTSNVRYLVSRFVESVRPRPTLPNVFAPIFSHRIEGDYRVSRTEISATPQGLAKLRTDLDEVLRLADLANLYDKRIAHTSWVAIHRASPRYVDVISPKVAQRFLSLLGQPPRLGGLLRRLHELRVLEKIVPPFKHARCLLQFNDYHKYTVDEHCLRAVEAATELVNDSTPLGKAYREIKQKRTLHLALLIHDLGKGFPEDHCLVGRRISDDIAQKFGMPKREAETMGFLVENHLIMAHLAFRRDTSDEQIVLQFAKQVGSADRLRMLYVLTCADLAAVGPGVLNDWKTEVLTELYARAMRHLSGGASPVEAASTETLRHAVIEQFPDRPLSDWRQRQIRSLPPSILRGLTSPHLAKLLEQVEQLGNEEVLVSGHFQAESGAVQYLVGSRSGAPPGMFYKLSGALTAQRLEILSAEVHSMPEAFVLGRFDVDDPDFSREPSQQRIETICHAVEQALLSGVAPRFSQVWGEPDPSSLQPVPTKVLIDNKTSEQYTIVDIFTFDRKGLLYSIGRTLHDLGLVIGSAKIGTSLDQVVDVFYVTDREGKKIDSHEQQETIRQTLFVAIAGHTIA